MSQRPPSAILRVRDLRAYFRTDEGLARAVDGVSFDVEPGETVALVGESGCGKTVTALSVMGLIDRPTGFHPSGTVHFEGRELLALSERVRCRVRGNRMAMVFQEPMSCLDPIYRVETQVTESLRHHRGLSRREARSEAMGLLERVGLADPQMMMRAFPHQLSGGMQQRVMIAIALACRPSLLIADEPTTALDVTIQAQILELLRDLQAEMGMAIVLITHDLGVVAELAERVMVMYAGRIVETASVDALFDRPRHPYTQGLLRALPSLSGPRGRLETIEGQVPSSTEPQIGCAFRDRCELAVTECADARPALERVDSGHQVRCLRRRSVG